MTDIGTRGPHPLDGFESVIGLDLRAYKMPQILRRIEAFMASEHIASLSALKERLRADPRLVEALRHHVTIHVTRVFRDPAYWQALDQAVRARPIPGTWQVWSTAASIGLEPLSVAALFQRMGRPVSILATDVDRAVVQRAASAEYLAAELEGLDPTARRELFDHRASDAKWVARPALRRQIRYRPLNLLNDPYPRDRFHLIVCRNVLIYFVDADRVRVLQQLAERLHDDGLLFLGATEVLLNPESLGLRVVGPALYARGAPREATARSLTPSPASPLALDKKERALHG